MRDDPIDDLTIERFGGFGPEALGFFRDLAAHNERTWFLEHKRVYEAEVLAPLKALLAELTTEFTRRKIPLMADPRRGVFRIHRDVRFSKDKAPYKTHAGAVMTRDGAKSSPGLLYVHIDPLGCFLASGFYQPEPSQLAALRQRMVDKPDVLRAMEAALNQAGLDLSREDALKRLPRGFEQAADLPSAHALRLRNLVTRRPLTAAKIGKPALVREIVTFAEQALPLLRFGWSVIP